MALTTGSTLAPSFPVVFPLDPVYEAACASGQRPAAIAYPADVREVAEVMRFAADRDLPVATDEDAVDGAVLVRTSAMTELHIHADRRIARAGAGVLWSDVVAAAAPHGLAALHSPAADANVVRHSLGDGRNWMARLYGPQSASVLAVELVTPAGEFVRTTAGRRPAGIVTAIEFELHPVTTVYAGVMAWDADRAAEVVPAWIEWAHDAPDAVTSVLRVATMPDGRRVVLIAGAVVGEEPEAGEFVRPLAILEPRCNTFAQIAAADLVRLHDDLPASRTPTPLDPHAAAATALAAIRIGADCELRQLGGALGGAFAAVTDE